MKLEIDHQHNVAYLYLREHTAPGSSVRQTFIASKNDEGCQIVVDWDIDGAIVGFEFVGARELLGPVLLEAGRPEPPPPRLIPPADWPEQ